MGGYRRLRKGSGVQPQHRPDRRACRAAAVLLAVLATFGAALVGPSTALPGGGPLPDLATVRASSPVTAVVSQVRGHLAAAHTTARATSHRSGPAPSAVLGRALPLAALSFAALLAAARRTPAHRRTTGACRVRAPPVVAPA